jgi:hypothetical protein
MFSQFLIIWMGNLPEEAGWYVVRSSPGWDVAAGILITAQLAVPFAVLLGRSAKRSYRVLWGVALLLLVSRAVEIFWLVAPDTNGRAALPDWRDVVALLAVGAVWCAPVVWRLRRSEA